MRTLYYSDNLPVLRAIPSASVDLIYLDPPFNSERAYNIIYPDDLGQMTAFEDTWIWTPECDVHLEEMLSTGHEAGRLVNALVEGIQKTQLSAYLVNMAVRLVEMHRILKSTGSLYIHCDPTASHYLKIVLDGIFGRKNFRNEIIWRRTAAHNKVNRWGPIHDVLLFYTSSDNYTWNNPSQPYMLGHVKKHFTEDEHGFKTAYYGNVLTGSGTRNGLSGKPWRGIDPTAKGRHWAIPSKLWEDSGLDKTGLNQHEQLDMLYEAGFIQIKEGAAWPMYERRIRQGEGPATGDIWAYQPYTGGTVYGNNKEIDADVSWIKRGSKERLYPTQKPLGLLTRILSASSNVDDVVLDPFCGCGTTIIAAENARRQWIGIDITYAAIAAIQERFKRGRVDVWDKIQIEGQPQTAEEVDEKLLNETSPLYVRKEFEKFCVTVVGGVPNDTMGADGGIDGRIALARGKQAIISVKSGKPTVEQIRSLKGLLDQKQVAGVFITRRPPTRPMRDFANQAGVVKLPASQRSLFTSDPFPVLQILMLEEILAGERPKLPGI